MNKEIKEYLKSNLRIAATLRHETDDIKIQLILEDETIDYTYIEGYHIRALQND